MLTPTSSAEQPRPTATEAQTAAIDLSCRLPMFALIGGAAFWLALSSVFAVIASIKFHSPEFLADPAWLSYGRVFPAWSNLLVYGFCIPAGLGVGLWILARLGRVPLATPLLIAAAAKLWHLGVLAGLIGILASDTTGFEWLEMPRYAAILLLAAFLMVGLCGFATHQARTERSVYPSQWFVLASLLWFPWIYTTAVLLLEVFPVRGVVQSAIAWWFSGNLLVVWTMLAGLAASFYFIPKLSERPLESHYLALFVFWSVILFGSFVGIPPGAALPAWMPVLSSAANIVMLVPAVAIIVILVQTLYGREKKPAVAPMNFMLFGAGFLILSLALLAASGAPNIGRVTSFTWFNLAQNEMRLYGFFAMTMFGAAYYILPRVAGIGGGGGKIVKVHFWCMAVGTALLTLPLAAGGIIQGLKLLDPAIPMVDVARSTLMALRLSTVGDTLIAIGNLLFLANVFGLILRYYRTVCSAAYWAAGARVEPAEVRP